MIILLFTSRMKEKKKTVPHLTDEEDELQNIVSFPNLFYLQVASQETTHF